MTHHQRPLWGQTSIEFEEATKKIADALDTIFQPKIFPTNCLAAADAHCGTFSISIVHFRCWDEQAAATPPCYWYFARWDATGRDFNYLLNLTWDPQSFSKQQVRRLRQKLCKILGCKLRGLGNA